MSINHNPALLPLMASFVRVVEHGSFSAAARLQGTSSSALSRQIAQLETHLGLRLLERTTRRLRLSEAGAEVFERCREMLAAADAALAVGERLMSHPRGLVRLSVPKAFGKYLVAPLMADFLAKHPEVDVSLNLSDRSPDPIAEGFDLAIRMGDLPQDSQLAARLDVHALTDVTGFGLLGHLLEVCRGAKLGAEVEMSRVPVIAEARPFAEAGVGPGAIERNLASFGHDVDFAPDVASWQQRILVDPQTSGGLLATVDAAHADEVLALFHAAGFGYAAVIGRLTEGAPRVAVR